MELSTARYVRFARMFVLASVARQAAGWHRHIHHTYQPPTQTFPQAGDNLWKSL